MRKNFFFLLFVFWTLYNMCILYVKLFLYYLYSTLKKSICGFTVLFLCCYCFVAGFIYMFYIFMTYSTSFCCHYKLIDPWNMCVRACACVTLGYRLDDWGFKSWQGLGIFLFTTASKLAPGPTQCPIQWVPGALSLEVKQLGCEADNSYPSSAKVKNALSYTPTPQYAFIVRYSVKKNHRDNFTIIVTELQAG